MKRVAPLLAIFLLTLRLSAQTNATTRVALVSDSGDREVANVLDLATVKLGRETAIEMVERATIARVLAEQHLSLSGAVDPNSVVSAGKLLAVDLFAVIDSVTQPNSATGKDSRTVAGLVVFDAKTGARLGDETLAASGIENLADAVVAGVLAAQLKQTAAGLPTICLMSVRNADLPRSLDRLCDSVGLLLERRLTASPACVVLERERLDQVNQERSLPTSAQQQQLLASLVLMELECGRGPDGKGMSASARLTDHNGKLLNTFSVTSPKANAAELAAALNQKISEAMQLKPGQAQEDRSQEADRFRQEAGFFLAHGDWEPGIQNLEAAFALAPENDCVRKQLAGALISHAGQSGNGLDWLRNAETFLKPEDDGLRRQLASALVGSAKASTNLLDSLRIANQGMHLFWECVRKAHLGYKQGSPQPPYDDFDEWDKYLRIFDGNTFQNAKYLSPAETEEARQLLRSVYEEYRSFRMDIALPALFQSILHHPDDGLFHRYGYVMLAGTWSTENISALFRDEWSSDWLITVKTYLALLEQSPLAEHPGRISEVRFDLNSLVLWPSIWQKVKQTDREEAWRLMAAHPCPLVRAMGKLDQLNGAKAARSHSGVTWCVAGEPYRLYLQDCLSDPTQVTNLVARRELYGASAETIFNYLGDADTVKFCNFMLEHDDLDPEILRRATTLLLAQPDGESAKQAVQFDERAITLLAENRARYYGTTESAQFKKELLNERDTARRKLTGVSEFPPAWREVRTIVDLSGAVKGPTQFIFPVVQGNWVYAVGVDGGQSLQLLKMPLSGGVVEVPGRIYRPGLEAKAACADQVNYYLGTSHGILIFPKTGGTVDVLDQNHGLPSDDVTALDCLDGRLYVGLGESGYLVGCDLKSRHCQTLCSARRREQLSPFDNGSPLRVTFVMADEGKQRIVFLTDQGGGSGRLEDFLTPAHEAHADVFPQICAKARSGLWTYTPASHRFDCILPRWPNANYYDIDWIGRASDTQFTLVCRRSRGMALFDLTTDKATLLCGSCMAVGLWWGVEKTLKKHNMIVNPAFHCPPLMGNRTLEADTASFVHGGWIWCAGRANNNWAGDTFCRASVITGRKEELPPLRAGDKDFAPRNCFRLIGSNQALIGDQRGLWLVTFSETDLSKQSANSNEIDHDISKDLPKSSIIMN